MSRCPPPTPVSSVTYTTRNRPSAVRTDAPRPSKNSPQRSQNATCDAFSRSPNSVPRVTDSWWSSVAGGKYSTRHPACHARRHQSTSS